MLKAFSILLFLCLLFSSHTSAQKNSSQKKRLVLVGLSSSLVITPLVLKNYWYDEPDKFHFFNDVSNWSGMDKLGHSFTAYHLTKQANKLYTKAGITKNKALLYSSLYSTLFQSSFEILDGFQSNYGFSWADVSANTLGTLLFAGQELLWNEQVFKLKFSYLPSPYAQYRPEILGKSHPERLLKDYNGQTYWLSFSPNRIFNSNYNKKSKVNLCIGYSTNEKLKGDLNVYTSGNKIFRAYNSLYLSVDINFENIEFKREFYRKLFSVFNTVKFPLPTLEFSNGEFNFHPIYF